MQQITKGTNVSEEVQCLMWQTLWNYPSRSLRSSNCSNSRNSTSSSQQNTHGFWEWQTFPLASLSELNSEHGASDRNFLIKVQPRQRPPSQVNHSHNHHGSLVIDGRHWVTLKRVTICILAWCYSIAWSETAGWCFHKIPKWWNNQTNIKRLVPDDFLRADRSGQ